MTTERLPRFDCPERSIRHISSQYFRTIWNKFELRYSFSVSRVAAILAVQQPSE